MQGHSTFEYLVYQTFDSLPFIILENAVKYAPIGSEVKVAFREEHNNLYVSVTSEGPFCDEEEIKNIFTKGFRGKGALSTKVAGSGLGLCLAKEICDAHDIAIKITSNRSNKIYDIPYGSFEVNLSFINRP